MQAGKHSEQGSGRIAGTKGSQAVTVPQWSPHIGPQAESHLGNAAFSPEGSLSPTAHTCIFK